MEIECYDFTKARERTRYPTSMVRYYIRGIEVMQQVVSNEQTLREANKRFLARSNLARQLQQRFFDQQYH